METAKIRDGAYGNFVTGMGRRDTDKTENTFVNPYAGTDIVELARIKVQDGIAARIVECVPETAFKEPVTITGDSSGKVFKEASAVGLFEALQLAGEYQRLTGGALIVSEYENEYDIEQLKRPAPSNRKISQYRVYSAGKVEFQPTDFQGDTPKVYRVVLLDNKRIEIHPSRCTVIHGKIVPDILQGIPIRERFFGMPALKACEQSLKNLANVIASIVNMATETGVMLFSLEGFNEMLSKPDCGIQDAQQLISLVKVSMSSFRGVFSGANDKFQILSHNFAGLPEVLQKAMNLVCADSRIPVSILFGQSATGLAQTNEGDSKAYAELVESWRSRYIYRPACSLIADLSERNCGIVCSEFEWGAVTTMSVKEKLEAMKMQAEMLNIYYQMGAIDEQSIREGIFKNGHSWDISVKD